MRHRSADRNTLEWANVAVLVACIMGAGCSQETDPAGSDGSDIAGTLPHYPEPTELLPELKVLEPASGGRKLFTDVVELGPLEDVTYCTFMDGITDQVSYIHSSRATQSRYGHHAVMYYSVEPQEPGTGDCGDMEKLRMVLGGTEESFDLPERVVTEVPTGVQLVINHHWINYGDEPARVQAMMVADPPMTDEELVVARSRAVVATDWELSPGEVTTATTDCVYEQDTPVVMTLGHEHQWGTHVRAEVVRADGQIDMLFDHPFSPEMESNPRVFYYPVETPLMIRAGDAIRFTCEWMNDTAETVRFPREMCVFFSNTLGGDDGTCINGKWL